MERDIVCIPAILIHSPGSFVYHLSHMRCVVDHVLDTKGLNRKHMRYVVDHMLDTKGLNRKDESWSHNHVHVDPLNLPITVGLQHLTD